MTDQVESSLRTVNFEYLVNVFEHIKRNTRTEQIRTLEDFRAKCAFIEGRNSYMYWQKGSKELSPFAYENKIRSALQVLQEVPKEHFDEIKDRFSGMIQPSVFPEEVTRCAYADEADWNRIFVVAETEDRYFGFYWYTTA